MVQHQLIWSLKHIRGITGAVASLLIYDSPRLGWAAVHLRKRHWSPPPAIWPHVQEFPWVMSVYPWENTRARHNGPRPLLIDKRLSWLWVRLCSLHLWDREWVWVEGVLECVCVCLCVCVCVWAYACVCVCAGVCVLLFTACSVKGEVRGAVRGV